MGVDIGVDLTFGVYVVSVLNVYVQSVFDLGTGTSFDVVVGSSSMWMQFFRIGSHFLPGLSTFGTLLQ